jgi:hypothetical protein
MLLVFTQEQIGVVVDVIAQLACCHAVFSCCRAISSWMRYLLSLMTTMVSCPVHPCCYSNTRFFGARVIFVPFLACTVIRLLSMFVIVPLSACRNPGLVIRTWSPTLNSCVMLGCSVLVLLLPIAVSRARRWTRAVCLICSRSNCPTMSLMSCSLLIDVRYSYQGYVNNSDCCSVHSLYKMLDSYTFEPSTFLDNVQFEAYTKNH